MSSTSTASRFEIHVPRQTHRRADRGPKKLVMAHPVSTTGVERVAQSVSMLELMAEKAALGAELGGLNVLLLVGPGQPKKYWTVEELARSKVIPKRILEIEGLLREEKISLLVRERTAIMGLPSTVEGRSRLLEITREVGMLERANTTASRATK